MRKPTLEFLLGIPMCNIGIPMWVFQLQPRNSEARKPTNIEINSFISFNLILLAGKVTADQTRPWNWVNGDKVLYLIHDVTLNIIPNDSMTNNIPLIDVAGWDMETDVAGWARLTNK